MSFLDINSSIENFNILKVAVTIKNILEVIEVIDYTHQNPKGQHKNENKKTIFLII